MNGVTVDYKRLNMTKDSQWLKIGEEFGEVIQAIMLDNPVEIILESLDVMETMWTFCCMIAEERGIDMDIMMKIHDAKLIDRGYVVPTVPWVRDIKPVVKSKQVLTVDEFRKKYCDVCYWQRNGMCDIDKVKLCCCVHAGVDKLNTVVDG